MLGRHHTFVAVGYDSSFADQFIDHDGHGIYSYMVDAIYSLVGQPVFSPPHVTGNTPPLHPCMETQSGYCMW